MTTLTIREKRLGLHLPVRVRGMDASGTPFTETTRTRNLSGRGICFESRRRLGVGTRLTLSVDLPEGLRPRFGNRATYRVRCVVCRVERLDPERVFRIGGRFLSELKS